MITNSIMSPSQEAVRFQSVFYKAQLVVFWDCWLIRSLKVKEVETDVQLSYLMRWKICYEYQSCANKVLKWAELKREAVNTAWMKRSLLLDVYVLRWRKGGPLIGKLWKVIVGMEFILFWCFGREYAILAQTLFLTAVSCSSPEAGAMTADTDNGGQHNHLMMIPMWQILAAFVKPLDCWSYCIETLDSWHQALLDF